MGAANLYRVTKPGSATEGFLLAYRRSVEKENAALAALVLLVALVGVIAPLLLGAPA